MFSSLSYLFAITKVETRPHRSYYKPPHKRHPHGYKTDHRVNRMTPRLHHDDSFDFEVLDSPKLGTVIQVYPENEGERVHSSPNDERKHPSEEAEAAVRDHSREEDPPGRKSLQRSISSLSDESTSYQRNNDDDNFDRICI